MAELTLEQLAESVALAKADSAKFAEQVAAVHAGLADGAKKTQIMEGMLEQIIPAMQMMTNSVKDMKISQYLAAMSAMGLQIDPKMPLADFFESMLVWDEMVQKLLGYADSWADAKLQEQRAR